MSVEKQPKITPEEPEQNTEFIGWPTAFSNWFKKGEQQGATHVIYCYMRTGEHQYFPRYVMPNEDVREVVKSVSAIKIKKPWGDEESINEASYVFTYSQPFETQWALTKNLTEPVFNF